ncbi:hypothetical protein STRTUCAR8_03562 [Streptomyces turgidiscabies Car8]|uniref:Uncharacterized protein n=1 Tax=Streptomyces turgidiscabies (strain Car8) TaxID=698760 RepID=L7FD43_STRT8|nr:hypothetical protein STRTUCAR8_03562 [Streptomyces turgidiscabies Car8]
MWEWSGRGSVWFPAPVEPAGFRREFEEAGNSGPPPADYWSDRAARHPPDRHPTELRAE